jgi:predicted unusual protein kinase regulating ubiquinone biosynthesis (AarF/ABC1/UbiB family)
LVDFGCVERFSPDTFRSYSQMMTAILTRDSELVASLFEKMGFVALNGSPEKLKSMAQDFLNLLQLQPGRSFVDINPIEELRKGIELLRLYPTVRVPHHFVMLGRVFTAMGGLLMHYRAEINLFAIILTQLSGTGGHLSG